MPFCIGEHPAARTGRWRRIEQGRSGIMQAADDTFMGFALEEARAAAEIGEVPIGAVVVCEGAVVATGCNRREIDHDPAGHAEFIAIREAARRLGRWRLSDCTVYVTLEPCPMCAGLMHQARVARCVFGASDPKAGALGTLYDLSSDERLNHRFDVTAGVRAEDSATLLKEFFNRLREGRDT
jgi:tRNA(adenine34) deaminase